MDGNVLVFSSGHFLRVLTSRWLGLVPSGGRYFKLGTATLSVLGYDHDSREEPVIRQYNESAKDRGNGVKPWISISGTGSSCPGACGGWQRYIGCRRNGGTLKKRFEKLKITSTPESRRDYRELLFTTPGSAEFISGVIMYDETIRQQSSKGIPLSDILVEQGMIPGIKVDSGAKPLAGSEGETVTEGLDGLRDRLKDYRAMGAWFAKWRAVIRITDRLPTETCVNANAHALGRDAALCQEQGIVSIVEPEVLMDGSQLFHPL